jgi:serine/threonine-protein kinase
MGRVYDAVHSELGKRFVVKVIADRLSTEPAIIERMRFEAQTLARLDHPNIVKVTDMGRLPSGAPFIVMERLEGRTLGAELRAHGRLGVLEALRWVRQTCAALAEAHAIGVVHRDIKLDNLFVHESPEGERVLKILDFGVAKALPGVSDRTPKPPAMPTEEGVLVGTPRYVSPEAARGEKIDQRADLYSTGIVLYMLLTGKHPFHDVHGTDALVAAHATREPDPPSKLARDPVPAELDRLVLRMLAKDPAERCQTAAELDRALARVEQAVQRPTGWMETTVFDPVTLAREEPAGPRPRPAPAPAPAPAPLQAQLMTTKPEGPVAVMALADTEPSVEPPEVIQPVAAMAQNEPARRSVVPLVLMVLSAVVVVVIGVLISR